jgi:hypothetical protein
MRNSQKTVAKVLIASEGVARLVGTGSGDGRQRLEAKLLLDSGVLE